MRKFITLLGILFLSIGLFAQSQTISGTVTNAETDETIPGVNILVKGTTNGTLTDLEGKYTLEVSGDAEVLVFSYVGFVNQEIFIGDKTTIDVALSPDQTSLEEVVVVGYGVKKKSLVTGSISKVEAEDLQSISSTRPDQALQGRTAGVSVLPTSGSPGAGTKIRIRGVNSNGDSNPLFIVDGMKTGDINNIDPSNIESIEVLKDAASSAIYGTEGANGVVLITTKSGTAGLNKVNYNFQYGLQSERTDMELMSASQYKEWMSEAGLDVSDRYGANTNWLDEVFETAPMQKHHLSFSGGNQKTTYLISGSYLNQDGIVGGNKANYERINARLNVKSDVKDWLQVGTNLGYMHSKRNYIGEDDEYRGVINNALLADPLTPLTYDGTPDHVQSLIDQGNIILQNHDGDYFGLTENVTGETANPVAVMNTYEQYNEQDKILGTAFANIKPAKGLVITSRVGLDLAYQLGHAWHPRYYFSAENRNDVLTIDDNINKWYTVLWENFANYTTTIDDHNISLLAGVSNERKEEPWFYMHSGPMVTAGDPYAYHDFTLGRDLDEVGGNNNISTMISTFGRFSYDYQNKYMFEASIRRDGASEFPTENKYATFSSFSGGWVASNEDFLSSGIMDYLKLRASWGSNGSRANTPGNEEKQLWTFEALRYIDALGNFIPGARIEKLPNPDLTWERNQMTDIGVDMRFFNSKLSFTADYFYKETKDLLTLGTGPLSAGVMGFSFVNAGSVVNKGFDFELGYRKKDNEFKYGVNLNVSFVDNEVTELNVDAPVSGANVRGYNLTWFEEGYPIWYFKGYKTDGVDADGNVVVVDVNGDGEISSADQTYIGDPHPDAYFGGNLFCEYKNFDFNLFFQGTSGNDIFMAWYRTDRPYSNKPSYFLNEDWNANNTSDYIYRSDQMIADGSYLRIKQIQLGYTFDKKMLSATGIQKLRAYVSLDNYFTMTDYQGLDPEAGSADNTSQGVDRGVYPVAGIFMFGLNVTF